MTHVMNHRKEQKRRTETIVPVLDFVVILLADKTKTALGALAHVRAAFPALYEVIRVRGRYLNAEILRWCIGPVRLASSKKQLAFQSPPSYRGFPDQGPKVPVD